TDSKNGRDEGNAKNNHGTFYDVQAISFALFARKDDVAKKLLESAKQNRIAKQIEPNGSQPLELERTQSWGYSTMNLEGFVSLAELGDAAGVDLWNYETKDDRSIRKAFDFLYPFATGEKKWTHKQIDPLKPERLYTLMRRANGKFRDKRFNEMMSAVPKLKTDDPEMLFHF
ncbi:MAG TPA: alginate lyase family protein, partial [Pyrinomonadaceae bacterium]|nr:alginate lyase family protein [Pyrinomonadaceae bacterium]